MLEISKIHEIKYETIVSKKLSWLEGFAEGLIDSQPHTRVKLLQWVREFHELRNANLVGACQIKEQSNVQT